MKYFCVAHWNALYVKNNSSGPCCVYKPTDMSPSEFINSKHRQNLQNETMIQKPKQCGACWSKEDRGLETVRNGLNRLYPNHNETSIRAIDKIEHLEIRESNLCNFACRMCNPNDSVELEREVADNTELQKYYTFNEQYVMTENNWQQTLKIAETANSIYLTGGEPMLIKRYYDLFERLISIGRTDITLRIFTNCSVFNPVAFNLLQQFKNVHLFLSIDGVGEVAEYQRYGTKWNEVRNNILRYIEHPFTFNFHSTISAYTILDFERLSDFYLEVQNAKFKPWTIRSVHEPTQLRYSNLNIDLRLRAITQLDNSITKLFSYDSCRIVVKELASLKSQLISNRNCDFASFVNMTKALDRSRNQSFEEVFGYKI